MLLTLTWLYLLFCFYLEHRPCTFFFSKRTEKFINHFINTPRLLWYRDDWFPKKMRYSCRSIMWNRLLLVLTINKLHCSTYTSCLRSSYFRAVYSPIRPLNFSKEAYFRIKVLNHRTHVLTLNRIQLCNSKKQQHSKWKTKMISLLDVVVFGAAICQNRTMQHPGHGKWLAGGTLPSCRHTRLEFNLFCSSGIPISFNHLHFHVCNL